MTYINTHSTAPIKSSEVFNTENYSKKEEAEKIKTDFNKTIKTYKAKLNKLINNNTKQLNGKNQQEVNNITVKAENYIDKTSVINNNNSYSGNCRKESNGKSSLNGTNIALKKIAEDFEKQVLGIMWNIAFATIDKEFQGGLGEEIFHKELVNEMVKQIDAGEIAENVYKDLEVKDAVAINK